MATAQKKKVKSVLSAKSTRIVLKVLELLAIPTNAKFYKQDSWMELVDDKGNARSILRAKQPPTSMCNTACCLAGWVAFSGARKRYKNIFAESLMGSVQEGFELGNQSFEIQSIGEQLLTLKDGTYANTSSLFSANPHIYWPEPFRTQWRHAGKLHKKHTKIAIARLKHFMETGE